MSLSWRREVMFSFRKMLRRWASIVRGLRYSWAPTSREVAPVATSRAMCSSWAVSASVAVAVRFRGCSPVARSSRAALAANASAPISKSSSWALRSCSRASWRRPSRRSHSP